MTFIVRAKKERFAIEKGGDKKTLIQWFDLTCLNRSIEIGKKLNRSECLREAMKMFIKKYHHSKMDKYK